MIALLVGHTFSHSTGEHALNRRIADEVVKYWQEIGWTGGTIIDVPESPSNGIAERIKRAEALDVSAIVEIHHNHPGDPGGPNDYSLALYHAFSPKGKLLAEHLREGLWTHLSEIGAERFVIDSLPNSKYGPKDVVEKSVPPAVILELAFMDSADWIQYYLPENIRLTGRLLGQTLKSFEENYGPKSR